MFFRTVVALVNACRDIGARMAMTVSRTPAIGKARKSDYQLSDQLSASPAILNAIHSAAGVGVKDLPVTPKRVWTLLTGG